MAEKNDFNDVSKLNIKDYKVSPLWAVAAVILILAVIIVSGIIIINTRMLIIEKDKKSYLTQELEKDKQTLAYGLEQANDVFSEQMLKELLPEQEIIKIAKTFWEYDLYIGGNPITSNDITVKPGNTMISIKQTEKERVLPINLHNKGSVTGGDLSDKFYDHLMFTAMVDFTMNSPLAKANPAVADYYLKNLKKGTVIDLNLSQPLKERLNLLKPNITITVS